MRILQAKECICASYTFLAMINMQDEFCKREAKVHGYLEVEPILHPCKNYGKELKVYL